MSRKANGQFGNGNAFGQGRPRGSRNLSTLIREHLRSDAPERAAKIIDGALEKGDMSATRVLAALSPRPRSEPIALDLPLASTVADILAAQNIVMQAAAREEITPDQAQNFMQMLANQRDTVQLLEIEQKLERLEAAAAEEADLRQQVAEAIDR